jgi:hypothetical protein
MTNHARSALFVLTIVATANAPAFAATITYSSEAAFDAATSAVLVDDFESVPTPDVMLPFLISNGIMYTPFAGAPLPNVLVASPGYTNFGAGVNPTTTSILVSNGDEDFVGALSSPALAVGFDVYLNGLGPASATFFNGATILGTVSFATGDDQQFAGILSDVPVTSFRWTSTLGGQLNTGIDNVVSGGPAVQAVPEPGTMGTMILISSGVIAAARRRLRGPR